MAMLLMIRYGEVRFLQQFQYSDKNGRKGCIAELLMGVCLKKKKVPLTTEPT